MLLIIPGKCQKEKVLIGAPRLKDMDQNRAVLLELYTITIT